MNAEEAKNTQSASAGQTIITPSMRLAQLRDDSAESWRIQKQDVYERLKLNFTIDWLQRQGSPRHLLIADRLKDNMYLSYISNRWNQVARAYGFLNYMDAVSKCTPDQLRELNSAIQTDVSRDCDSLNFSILQNGIS